MQRIGDAHHPCLLHLDLIAGADADLNGLLVIGHHAGNPGRRQHRAGDTVRIHLLDIHLVKNLRRDDAGQSRAQSIAVGGLGKVQEGRPLHRDAAAGIGCGEGAGNVGIHAGAGIVFSDLIHHQHIAGLHQQGGHVPESQLQQLRLPRQNVLRQNGLQLHGLVVSIFQTGNGEQNLAGPNHHLRHGGNVLRNVVHAVGVYEGRALLLAETHGHHLAGAGLHLAAEGIVGLQPAGNDDAVRLEGIFIHIHRLSSGRNAQLHHLHGGLDGTAHALRGNVVALQYLQLALGCGTAMTSHGRHNKGLRALLLDEIHNGLRDNVYVPNAPASRCDGNPHPWSDLRGKGLLGKLPLHHTGNLLRGNPIRRKYLLCMKHPGNRNIPQKLRNLAALCHLHLFTS